MQAAELLNELKARGVVLEVRGDRIRVGPRDSVPPEILADLRAHKSELMDLLTWPAECLEAEREHGHLSARLYPLLDRQVSTPMGPGRLVAALPERAVVILDRRRNSFAVFLPGEITPLQARPQRNIRSEVH